MATIDQIVKDIQDESELEDRVLAALSGVQQQLKDALSGLVIPADVQAKIDSAFQSLEANKEKLASAVATP